MKGIDLTHLETGSLLSDRALFEASLAAPFEASSISHHHPLRSISGRRKKLDFGGLNYPSKHLWPLLCRSSIIIILFFFFGGKKLDFGGLNYPSKHL